MLAQAAQNSSLRMPGHLLVAQLRLLLARLRHSGKEAVAPRAFRRTLPPMFQGWVRTGLSDCTTARSPVFTSSTPRCSKGRGQQDASDGSLTAR